MGDHGSQVEAARAALQEVEEMREAVRSQCATIGGNPAMYGKATELAERAQLEREEEDALLALDQERHDIMAAEIERLEASVKSALEEQAKEAGMLGPRQIFVQPRSHME